MTRRWLLDASVLVATEDPDDPNQLAALRLLTSADWISTLDLAFYEATNVAMSAWRDEPVAERLHRRLAALADADGVIRADMQLLHLTQRIAREHSISVYDAAYVAAARLTGAGLVSCDVRDLVSRSLAVLPAEAVAAAQD